jgi:hypothetical protein
MAAAKAFAPRNDRHLQPTMKPEPPETEKNFDHDLETIAQLPAGTRELVIRKDQAEMVTGPESAALDKTIRDKSK